MPKPKIICLTPVLNESWILERFLKCASLWADHIIVADQGSTDGSKETAQRFPKVRFFENAGKKYDEKERQQMLLAEARRIPGPRLLLAPDADEFLTANFLTSPEWETMLNAPPGTAMSFQWPFVHTNLSRLSYYSALKEITIGYVDDGGEHRGQVIHSSRVPVLPGAKTLHLKQIKLMHYCMMDHDRFDSRIRWYQCWEQLHLGKRPIDLYRFYHPDLFVPPNAVKPVPVEWIQGYEQNGIDVTSVNHDGNYRWDREVLQFFDEHGTAAFKRLAIWDIDWSRLHADVYPGQPKKRYPDPRSGFEKLMQRWLRWTQRCYCFGAAPNFPQRLHHRLVEKAVRPLGW